MTRCIPLAGGNENTLEFSPAEQWKERERKRVVLRLFFFKINHPQAEQKHDVQASLAKPSSQPQHTHAHLKEKEAAEGIKSS